MESLVQQFVNYMAYSMKIFDLQLYGMKADYTTYKSNISTLMLFLLIAFAFIWYYTIDMNVFFSLLSLY